MCYRTLEWGLCAGPSDSDSRLSRLSRWRRSLGPPADVISTGSSKAVMPAPSLCRPPRERRTKQVLPSRKEARDASPDTGPAGCVPSSCSNSQGCDGGTCATVCSGCCKCDTQVCPSGEANKQCDARCTAGATCSVDCVLKGPCELTCDDCTSSSFHCTAAAGDCSTQCSPGSTCVQTCDSTSAACGMTCPKGATCQLECAGSSCNLDCEDGSLKDCGNGVLTCNKSCPP